MNRSCADKKCSGIITEKGNIFCCDCIEKRKTLSKLKIEYNMEELLNKNIQLEQELKNLKQIDNITRDDYNMIKDQNIQLENMLKEMKNTSAELDKFCMYKTHLEKDNNSLLDIISKLKLDNQALLKEREMLCINYEQLKLDYEEIKIKNDSLRKINVHD